MKTPDQPDEPQSISAEKARGGDIVLRRKWQRRVFIAGLAGFVLLAFVGFLFSA